MWKDYKVIDADAHMHEPIDMWERHLEPRYRDRAPKVAYMNGTFMVYEPDGKIISKDEKQVKGPPKDSFEIMGRSTGKPYRNGGRRDQTRIWTVMAGTCRCFFRLAATAISDAP